MSDINKVRDVAVRAAEAAGDILLQHFKNLSMAEIHGKEVDGHASPVTDWDLRANSIIKQYINESFPDHDILSEEAPFEDNPGQWVWVVDPLDGTWNYINGQPFWGVSIGVFEGQEPRVAVINVPVEDDIFIAVHGQGAFRNQQRLQVDGVADLSKAIIAVGYGHEREAKEFNKHAFSSLEPVSQETHTHGAAALEMIRVAHGEQSGAIMAGIKVWDVAGGVLIVREAGGRATDLAGRNWDLKSRDVFASNGRLHDQVLEIIKHDH